MALVTRREFLSSSAAAAALSCGAGKPPNILLVLADQLRYDWTGLNPGIPVRTPHFNDLAARGVQFENCYCASPLCAPSRACLAAGVEYDRCGVPDNSLNYPIDQTTYYSLLRDAGYHVLGCGKFDLHKPEPSWGVAGQHLLPEWGFSAGIDSAGKWDAIRWGMDEPCDPYTAHLHETGRVETHREDFGRRREIGTFAATFPTPLPEESYCDNWIAAQGLQLLQDVPPGMPWHLVVNFAGPHEPVDITRPMDELYRGIDFPQPNRNTQFTPQKHVEIRRNYAAMIENIDSWLGKFLEAIDQRGESDATIVAFSSDHGEMLGDHDLWMKRVPRQASVAVPLVVGGPGMRNGSKSAALVSLMDLAATFLDYAGVPVPSAMDSRSLRAVLDGSARAHREHLISGLDPWRCITDGRLKLIRGYAGGRAPSGSGHPVYPAGDADAEPLLFDIQEDPFENRNLAREAPDDVARLTDVLHGLVGKA